MKVWIFSLFFFLILSTALHADECKLPVCDIPTKIAEMREKGQAYRFDVVSHLRKSARATKDFAELQNIVEFATKALALSKELSDESWMIGECQGLLDQGLLGILKFGEPKANEMLPRYELQQGEAAHFEILVFWRNLVPTLEDLEVLRNLIRFGVGASDISKGRAEPEYIVREALSLARDATARVGILDPSHEGMYNAVFRVPGVGPVEYRMAVLESTTPSGIIVGFINKGTGKLDYLFTNASFNFDLTQLRADSLYDGYTARFVLAFNSVNGTFEGWLRDTRYPEDIPVRAGLIRSPVEYFRNGKPPRPAGPQDIEGQYEGVIGNIKGIINIKRFGQKVFAATFFGETSREGNGVVLKFQTGTYNVKAGVLTLIDIQNDSLSQKLTLAFREDHSDGLHVKLVGFNFGMNNFDPQASAFSYNGPVDEEHISPIGLLQKIIPKSSHGISGKKEAL